MGDRSEAKILQHGKGRLGEVGPSGFATVPHAANRI